MSTTPRVALAFAIGVLLAAVSSSCREDDLIAPDRNREPQTFITGAPREQSDAGVHVHFYWRGHDPDGAVLSYQVAVDDTSFTAWTTTERTDSIFLFQVEATESRVDHTFYVVAVDDDGKRDSSPASRTFTAVDFAAPLVGEAWGTYELAGVVAPVRFEIGDTVPSRPVGEDPYTVKIHWKGIDADGVIVRYLYHVGDGPESTLTYQETVSVDLGPVLPKTASDGTPYFLSIFAVDDAGLQGGAGAAGVEAARLEFVVDKVPRSSLDSVVVNGMIQGTDYNLGTKTYFAIPPDTITFSAAELASGAVRTFLSRAKLDIHYASTDPEDGCVKDAYWVSTAGSFSGGSTRSSYQIGSCDGTGTTRGVLRTDSLVISTSGESSRTMWARGRDSHLREESPGPKFLFRVNAVPVAFIDSVGVGTAGVDSLRLTVLGHGTDLDSHFSELLFEAFLDGVRFPAPSFPLLIPRLSWSPGPPGTPHRLILRASNQPEFIRVTADTVDFMRP